MLHTQEHTLQFDCIGSIGIEPTQNHYEVQEL